MKKIFNLIILVFLLISSNNVTFSATKTPTKSVINYTTIQSPILLTQNPFSYLNKNIQFTGIFNKFSVLGLDYTPAMRSSKDYIGILINRDDVGENIIPLSELKMFIKRNEAKKLMTLETGNKILVKGIIFSAALGDPWMEIKEIKILTPPKSKESTKTETTETTEPTEDKK